MDVYCDQSIKYFSLCFYFGMLNFGPVLKNNTFLNTFENKIFTISTDENIVPSYFLTIGDPSPIDCYWVPTKLEHLYEGNDIQFEWHFFADDLLVNSTSTFPRSYLYTIKFDTLDIIPKPSFDLIASILKDFCGVRTKFKFYYLGCSNISLTSLNYL